jgi:glycerol-3-phosphate dehydrogenase
LRKHVAGAPLDERFKRGFVYSDGWVDDARLVVLNAIDAAEKGAHVLTRTACRSLTKEEHHWLAILQPAQGAPIEVRTRCVVNASGPWAVHFLQECAHHPADRTLRLIKGSHIVVKRLFDHPYAYIFQHPDGRIVFAIPYQHEFTLIGTTDIDYHGDPNKVAIDAEEVSYLCELISRYFKKAITPGDVVWSYSGVRPLVEDEAGSASAVTRDYRLELDHDHGMAPMLSVFGGKITTFRKLAEEAVDLVMAALKAKPAPDLLRRFGHWTGNACLPGGDLFGAHPSNKSVLKFEHYVHTLQKQYAWLPPALVARYARAYGTRIHVLLDGRSALSDMSEEIAAGLYAAEVSYLVKHEWARTAEDILWRRSKLGLHLPADSVEVLNKWLTRHHATEYD